MTHAIALTSYVGRMRALPWSLGLALALGSAACSSDATEGEEGENGDDAGVADDTECSKLCERVVFCTAKAHADDVYMDEYDPQDVVVTCEWTDPDAATAECLAGCRAAATGEVARDCIACLADRLVCQGSAAMRPCDVDCEVTDLVTGQDGEGAPEYDYTSWFFASVDDADLWDCSVEPE